MLNGRFGELANIKLYVMDEAWFECLFSSRFNLIFIFNFYLTFEINQMPMKGNEVPTSNETDHNVTPGNV